MRSFWKTLRYKLLRIGGPIPLPATRQNSRWEDNKALINNGANEGTGDVTSSTPPVYWTEKDCAKAFGACMLGFGLGIGMVAAISCLFHLHLGGWAGGFVFPVWGAVETILNWRRIRRGEKVAKRQAVPTRVMGLTARCYNTIATAIFILVIAVISLRYLVPPFLEPHSLARFVSAVYLLGWAVFMCWRLGSVGLRVLRTGSETLNTVTLPVVVPVEEAITPTPCHWWTDTAARDEAKQPLGRK